MPWWSYSACVEINTPQGEPCGIALRANNWTSVEMVFHGASCKDAKDAKFEEIERYLDAKFEEIERYLSLRSRLSQINLRPISPGLRLIRLSPRLIRPLADSGGVLARKTLLKSFC
jgi:hypothetical protein